ncbi:MAG: Gfo/Idh/MocA family oxidoreductase [Victivallaceae bacterium]|mgnify:CR=1 FL=1|jgi:predicted dehydrogenase|nr:Gfo/Idh/MocA family oxidoreductase [Victivallaceae bacterium]MDD3115816.1 Gfo/Idh/MocA family oxidoreductase [Victivallaceae bacterium]MDD3704381.1 Gfo/Idh/MocA family oxidoreductase [Victivallaceae bacterium]MDD4318576.1 Gfo/Idh/MocA family oxidoreductase [Victivallaceae bacterium]MDD5664029.1 Gfo/Idh/MocA family oxidoreductase [Victivallaceae bacterium]
MFNPIKVGVAGLGRAGYGMHLRELLNTEGRYEITACCDIDPERCKSFVEKLGKPCRCYQNYDEMLNDTEVELVSIAVRSPEHTDYSIKALNAGKYVFCEKPIALTLEEALRLKAESEKFPGKLFLRHNRRFEPCYNHIREIMDSGILGQVHLIRLRRHSYQRRDDWQTIIECGGGMLNNWGPHIIDHSLHFLESPVKKVWSNLRKVAAVGDAEDHLSIIFEGENGRLVDMEISGGAALSEPVYMVYGDRGALISQDEKELKMRYIDPEQKLMDIKAKVESPPLDTGFKNPEQLKWIEKTIPVDQSSQSDTWTWQIWNHMYESIRNGKAFPITIDEGVEVVKYTEMARQGSGFGR